MAPTEDPVDPKPMLDEKCTEHHCAKPKVELDKCTERVTGKSATTETCTQEYFEFLHCVDHCASEKLFKLLK